MNNSEIVKSKRFLNNPEAVWAFITLYSKFILKNKTTYFFLLFLPFSLAILLGFLMPTAWVWPAVSLLPILLTGIQGSAGAVAEWKKTSVIKNIGLSSITKGQFLFSITVVHLFLGLIAWIVILFVLLGFSSIPAFNETQVIMPHPSNPQITDPIYFNLKMTIEWAMWGYVFLFAVLMSLFSISLGYLIGMTSKSINQANLVGVILALFMGFLSGFFLSIYSIRQIDELNYMTMALPTRWIMNGYMNFFYGWKGVASISIDISKADSIWYFQNNPFINPGTTEVVYSWNEFGVDFAVGAASTLALFITDYYMTNFSKNR